MSDITEIVKMPANVTFKNAVNFAKLSPSLVPKKSSLSQKLVALNIETHEVYWSKKDAIQQPLSASSKSPQKELHVSALAIARAFPFLVDTFSVPIEEIQEEDDAAMAAIKPTVQPYKKITVDHGIVFKDGTPVEIGTYVRAVEGGELVFSEDTMAYTLDDIRRVFGLRDKNGVAHVEQTLAIDVDTKEHVPLLQYKTFCRCILLFGESGSAMAMQLVRWMQTVLFRNHYGVTMETPAQIQKDSSVKVATNTKAQLLTPAAHQMGIDSTIPYEFNLEVAGIYAFTVAGPEQLADDPEFQQKCETLGLSPKTTHAVRRGVTKSIKRRSGEHKTSLGAAGYDVSCPAFATAVTIPEGLVYKVEKYLKNADSPRRYNLPNYKCTEIFLYDESEFFCLLKHDLVMTAQRKIDEALDISELARLKETNKYRDQTDALVADFRQKFEELERKLVEQTFSTERANIAAERASIAAERERLLAEDAARTAKTLFMMLPKNSREKFAYLAPSRPASQ